MIEKLKMHLLNTFFIELIMNICEQGINICEKFFAKRFFDLFVVIAFANFLSFKFIKIINWFDYVTLFKLESIIAVLMTKQ